MSPRHFKPKTCTWCGAKFTPTAPRATYCIPECFKVKNRERMRKYRAANKDSAQEYYTTNRERTPEEYRKWRERVA